jgi:hypothetical protein
MKHVIVLLAALMAPATTLPAAPPPPGPPDGQKAIDPETFAAALALFEQEELEAQMMAVAIRGADDTLNAQLEVFRKAGTDIPDDLVERLRSLLLAEVRSGIEEISTTIRADAARIYARHFSAAELRELKALQSHPVMKKFDKVMPQLLTEMNQISARAMAERMPQVQAKTKALVEEWLREQRLGVSTPEA